MIFSTLENGAVQKRPCELPHFDYSCDVLIIGAGAAGVYAADSAAREGADVILCEISENIGGMHVCGGVAGYYYGAKGGSYEEDDRLNKEDTVFLANEQQWEQRQIRVTERLAKSTVRLFTRHSALGLYMDGDRVIGICAFDGSGKVNIKAHITIDATSDGHLIRMTDTPKQYGRPSDGSFVPFGVYIKYTRDGKLFARNNDSGIMDHYAAEDFSQKSILAHANLNNFLESGDLVNIAHHTGVREGLTFTGEETLRYEDVLLGKTPEKVLFWAYSDLDRHGSERASEEEMFQNWWVISNLATVTIRIPVPFGSIIPKGIKGLVTAGRCLSCDTYIQSAVRMNRDMFRMGECIGIAAAMAVKAKVDIPQIDYDAFLNCAQIRGSYTGNISGSFYFDTKYQHYLNKMQSLGLTPDPKYANLARTDYICKEIIFDWEKNFHQLQTDSPGVAIWSCYLAKDKAIITERLCRELETSKDNLYRYNCAITLGLLGDNRCVPLLREIIKSRDCFFFKDNRRSNQFRAVVAVCLLGRLGNEQDLPLLMELLSAEEIDREMYHTLEANYLYHTDPDRNFVYFQMLTHTCMAIYKIYRRCNLSMKELHQFFQNLFAGDTILRRVTDAKPGQPAYEEMTDFIKHLLKLTT